ncbi:hypothetical protein OSCI_3440005 [Kamptonema sp. PCC 6506]|nr:hypothetical protein OSCI_3440005 [Kamptonema sp. PCC 6506]
MHSDLTKTDEPNISLDNYCSPGLECHSLYPISGNAISINSKISD